MTTSSNSTKKEFLSNHERFVPDEVLIVSKTDVKGVITYANPSFIDISGYPESELLEQPHSLVRHPQMPRGVFSFLWETILEGREVFAYVVNRCKNGDHYWVYTHVTPCLNQNGEIQGFHSNRRSPNKALIESHVIPLYQKMLDIEKQQPNKKQAAEQSLKYLVSVIETSGYADYDEWIHRLTMTSEN